MANAGPLRAGLLIAASTAMAAASWAAELPARTGAPAPPKARACKIDGVDGFVLAGGETCLRISGGVGVEAIVGRAPNPSPSPSK